MRSICDEKVKAVELEYLSSASTIKDLQSKIEDVEESVYEKDSVLELLEKKYEQSVKEVKLLRRENKDMKEKIEEKTSYYEDDLCKTHLQLEDIEASFNRTRYDLEQEHKEDINFLNEQNLKKVDRMNDEISKLRAELSASAHDLKSLENHLNEKDMIITSSKEKEDILSLEDDILRSQISSLQHDLSQRIAAFPRLKKSYLWKEKAMVPS